MPDSRRARRARRPQLLAALAASLAALLGPQAAQAEEISSRPLASDPAAVRDYWTPERMREAVSLDQPADDGAVASAAAAVASGQAASGPDLYSDPPDMEIAPSLDTTYPYRIHGKLFFKIGLANAACSATVVTSRSRNVLLTAGHCVVTPTVQGPVWSNTVLFAPGYRNGATPLGTYAGTMLRAPSLWSVEGVLTLDVGTINLAAGPSGQIEDALGSRGISFNRPSDRYKKNKTEFSLFGYPAEPTAFYDGERPILCQSPFKGFEKFVDSLTAGPCNMKQGSSGGGWVLGGGFVNSVISHNSCGTDPNCTLIGGTYLGDTAYTLWKKSGGGISKSRQKKLKGCKNKPKKGGKKANCIWKAEKFGPTTL